ncbi:MAG TPA: ABC transporter permease, partial [Candidatus Binataceae bacterium]
MKIWAIMRRDLLKLMRNPLTLISTVIMPIVYLVIIGNSFHGVLKNLPVAVVAEDNGAYAQRVLEKLQALAAGPKTITLTYLGDPQKAIQGVREGRFKGAVVIPPDFSRDIAHGLLAEVGLFTDNVDAVSSETLEGV